MFGRKLKNQISKLKAQITLLTIDKEAIEKASNEMAAKYREDLVRLDEVKAENAELKKQIEELKLKISRKGQKRGADGRFVKKVEKREFKVGDKVKIVDGFKPEKYRKLSSKYPAFPEEMDLSINRIGVVVNERQDLKDRIPVSFGLRSVFYYHPDWLEHVE